MVVAALLLVATPAVAAAPLDYVEQARTLAAVAACLPGAVRPARFDAQVIDAHCRLLAALQKGWRRRWLSRAKPFLERIVPADLPQRVVYPFGGGDLVTALVTFPAAVEISTLSLEPAGDPRAIDLIAPADLEEALVGVRLMAGSLFAVAHSKTTSMRRMAHAKFPGELTSSLVALVTSDYEPVSLRYFQVGPTGDLQYLSPAELQAAGTDSQRALLFANMEIEFQPRGGAGAHRVFRHFAANLDNRHLSADPGVLRHLEAKGPVTAMTKAASYLLWWQEFSQIRGYLLAHMVWMISDSTGIPSEEARAAGFEQIPYGRFEGPFLRRGGGPAVAFQTLWAEGAQPLSFRFGYPDSEGNAHLLITRHPGK
jgi:hypothetical protein